MPSDLRVAGLLPVALLFSGCGCFSDSFHDRQVCGPAGRAVLVVADDAAETKGVEVLEAVFERTDRD